MKNKEKKYNPTAPPCCGCLGLAVRGGAVGATEWGIYASRSDINFLIHYLSPFPLLIRKSN